MQKRAKTREMKACDKTRRAEGGEPQASETERQEEDKDSGIEREIEVYVYVYVRVSQLHL